MIVLLAMMIVHTDCDDDCGSNKTSGDCIKCGLDQWGIMIKGGMDF